MSVSPGWRRWLPQVTPSFPGERRTAAIAAALIALGPLALLLYTPALPLLEGDLGISQVEVQFTVITYFVGFTFAQLIYGPLSDAFGRRIVCLWAGLFFVASSLGAFVAPNIEVLTVFRVLQGIGAAVGAAVSRAIVRDTYQGRPAERILNLMALMLGIGPAIAPFVGGLIVDFIGWRYVFAFMVCYGLCLLLGIYFLMPETNTSRNALHAHPGRIIRRYLDLFGDSRFIVPTLVATLIMSNFYAISTALPYVLIVQGGMSSSTFGLSLLLQPVLFSAGSILAGGLMNRMPLQAFLPMSMVILALSAIALPAAVLAFGPGFWSVVVPLSITGFASALMLPVFWAQPLAPFAHAAGAASSLFGFLQYGMGLLGSLVATAIGDPTSAVIVVGPGMLVLGIGIYMATWQRFAGKNPSKDDEN